MIRRGVMLLMQPKYLFSSFRAGQAVFRDVKADFLDLQETVRGACPTLTPEMLIGPRGPPHLTGSRIVSCRSKTSSEPWRLPQGSVKPQKGKSSKSMCSSIGLSSEIAPCSAKVFSFFSIARLSLASWERVTISSEAWPEVRSLLESTR